MGGGGGRRHAARQRFRCLDAAVDDAGELDQLAEVGQVEQLGQQVIRIVPSVSVGGAAAGQSWHPDDFASRLRTDLLVLQATPFCNIDCSYCYLPHRQDRSRMSLKTLQRAAQRLREDGLLGDTLSVVWHAGEPLAVPVHWYEAAFDVLARELGAVVQLSHAMQTNATLIDAAWCAFFRRHGVQVGVSVDGPQALHDRHRRTRRGHGTHDAVLRGMQQLRQHGVPFHAIAVVGAETLNDPEGFYDWFAEQGVAELGCNFDETEGAHAGCSSLAGHEAAHATFMQRLLQRSMDDGRVAVRELVAAQQLLRHGLPQWQVRGRAWPVNTQTMPLALITVRHDGAFGSFSPELLGQHAPAYDDFVLGNVHDLGYLQALQGRAFVRLWQGIHDGIRACERQCAYFEFCGGGAPANKFYECGDFAATETLYCRSMLQRPLDAVLQQAERALGLAA